MAKKPTAKQLTAKADQLFSLIVRARGFCINCGTTQDLQCAHGFSRRYRAVRWDVRNAWPLCRGCHMYFTHRPIEWDNWMLDRMGLPLYEQVRQAALAGEKQDMPAVLERLRERARELELV